MTEHFCEVPLRYALDGDGKATSSTTDTTTVVVFAREISSTKLSPKTVETLPYLVYLQGGPGFESPRPLETAGWFDKACESFRVLLLDQRGTGRSPPTAIPRRRPPTSRTFAPTASSATPRSCATVCRSIGGPSSARALGDSARALT